MFGGVHRHSHVFDSFVKVHARVCVRTKCVPVARCASAERRLCLRAQLRIVAALARSLTTPSVQLGSSSNIMAARACCEVFKQHYVLTCCALLCYGWVNGRLAAFAKTSTTDARTSRLLAAAALTESHPYPVRWSYFAKSCGLVNGCYLDVGMAGCTIGDIVPHHCGQWATCAYSLGCGQYVKMPWKTDLPLLCNCAR